MEGEDKSNTSRFGSSRSDTEELKGSLKVAEQSFGSLRVYVICQIMAIKRKVVAHKLKVGK